MNVILIVGVAWTVFGFVVGFLLGVSAGYWLAYRSLPEVRMIREAVGIVEQKPKKAKK